MTKNRDLKLLIRARMAKTGESYSAARRHIENRAKEKQDKPPSRANEYGPPTPAHNHIKGWRGEGFTPDYEFTVDRTQGYRTPCSALLRSLTDHALGSSTRLMQAFLAEHYRGRRITLSAWIKSEGLTGSCRIWMRLYQNTRELSFVESALVTGSTEWTRRDVTLDVVDQEATMILIGIKIEGAGAAWVGDVEIEAGKIDVATDDHEGLLPLRPRNLNFVD